MLTELTLQHFRNHCDKTVSFGEQTVIVGKNGAGKTNVLEAISMLSLTSSWRAGKDSEVVAWDAPFARITSGVHELVVQRKPYYKRIRIDGVSKRASEVVGMLPTVLFQPDDSQLVSGSPTYRRQAMDRLLCQTDHKYFKALSQLQRVLKQRNKLLKQVQEGAAAVQELDYWDEMLATETVMVCTSRKSLIPFIETVIKESFSQLVPDSSAVTIQYHVSPKHVESAEQVTEHLRENRYKEIAAGVTLYGPQREDITFMWGEHAAAESMSRGQVRALVLAWKLAEVRYLESHTTTRPILLLDDVFSEFDGERRLRVTELVRQYQSILTTTEPEQFLLGTQACLVEL